MMETRKPKPSDEEIAQVAINELNRLDYHAGDIDKLRIIKRVIAAAKENKELPTGEEKSLRNETPTPQAQAHRETGNTITENDCLDLASETLNALDAMGIDLPPVTESEHAALALALAAWVQTIGIKVVKETDPERDKEVCDLALVAALRHPKVSAIETATDKMIDDAAARLSQDYDHTKIAPEYEG
jgi:hypothetical protein